MKQYEFYIIVSVRIFLLPNCYFERFSIALDRREQVGVELVAHHADSANGSRPSLTVHVVLAVLSLQPKLGLVDERRMLVVIQGSIIIFLFVNPLN